jgi:hypothetical protein
MGSAVSGVTGLGGFAFPGQRSSIEAAVRHEEYLARARTLGASREVAEAELAAVRGEIYDSAWRPCGIDQEHDIAWRRLTEGGPEHRPGDQIRGALRANFPNAHPEWIDSVSRQVAPGETLAKELLRLGDAPQEPSGLA